MALTMAQTQLACSRGVAEHIGNVPFTSVSNGGTAQTTARIALGYLSANQYEVLMNTRRILANQEKIMAKLGIGG
ncbi:MAG: hypothetical protein QJR09_07455 [Micrococcus sp.]|nr:hypothetical protein [Micrococcus sp.]